MNIAPQVSVVIPVKNGERYLRTAIESVLNQTYSASEIIVVDDQSTDDTLNIAQSYTNVQCVAGPGLGSAAAYNQGITAATGELIAFLDHDDYWASDKLAVQISYLISHPEVQYAIAEMQLFLEPGHPIPPGLRPELLEKPVVAPLPGTLMARKTVFEQVGLFNPTLNTAEDVDWFARCHDAQIVGATIPQVLLHKRVHQTNLSFNATNNNQNLLKVLRASIQRKRQLQQES
ncbi:glycosyltransferase [Oscillatoria sp. FACHB-1407]|uniref:glycosyltransferase n=1 Tax=Oscillatoria sp. FACHB-1407 TaxID=2692847 RepID=UPI001684E2A0|nr:glycosyltransferase [Oscillatoria sp. FACHB-1407]MBD2459422.1 glycosyltransferase [Oscillatoria sp. FACHB-1407]